MALADLLAALEREAAAQAEARRAAARAAAAEIARSADERLERRRSEAALARETELRRAAETALDEARRAARRSVLDARERLLERVFAAARGLLPEAMARDGYRAVLPRHVADALRAVGDQPAVVRCPDALGDAVRAALGPRRDVTVETDPAAPPGITAGTTDGAVAVDNTLPGRLDRARPRLAIAVLARLKETP
jgi:vacuolar-type H+-ATPase subunit E/Vma4